ncbi:MAG: hypothetical protein OHK0057_26060 [Thermoflexibacter sp.]
MRKDLKEIAMKYDLSLGAVIMLFSGLQNTQGNQVQFNHPELGGVGQWQAGMIMIGDMFNHALKAKINELCHELALIVKKEQKATPKKSVIKNFDAIYGTPALKGTQNDLKYAYYPAKDIFIIEQYGKLEKYSTEGYQVTGISQQQNYFSQDLIIQTDKGNITLSMLTKV